MKWPFISLVLAFACLSFASSAPMVLDETAMMYPAYPYMPYDGLNFDIGKFFRKAANSVKHFYSYMNSWIFGKNNGQYWKGQQDRNDSQHPAVNLGRVHIEAYKVYKDADGRVIVKNIPNLGNLNIPMSPNVLNKVPIPQNPGFIGPIVLDDSFNALMQDPRKIVKKDHPNGLENAMQNIILNNPFRWNEKLANDQMLGKSADRIIVHPLMVRLQGQIPLDGAFGGILNDQQLQNIIAQQMQNQQSQAQPKEEPKAETNVPPQTTEPAEKQENKTKAPVAEEKQNNNDQADDDEEDSDDDQNDEATETNNAHTTVSEVTQNEQSTQPKEQPKNSESQANANAVQNPVQNNNNEPKPGQHPSGLDNIFVQEGNQDDADTIRKVLAMVQPQNNANNQNDAFMNFRW